MRENEIKKLSEREHCLLRPNMYIGSTKKETFENELVFDEDILKVESLNHDFSFSKNNRKTILKKKRRLHEK